MFEPTMMNKIIKRIATQFAFLYSLFPEDDKLENNGDYSLEDLLWQGYCLPFASLLQVLFPESIIVRNQEGDHYIIKYDNHYYDFRGLIPISNNEIEIIPKRRISLTSIIEEPIRCDEEFQRVFFFNNYDETKWAKIFEQLLPYSQELILNSQESISLQRKNRIKF